MLDFYLYGRRREDTAFRCEKGEGGRNSQVVMYTEEGIA